MDSCLNRLQQALTSATRDMTPSELGRHLPGKWSTAEILEHLYLTYTGTIKGFERCLQAGKPLATVATLKQRYAVVLVIGVGYMPRGREAPKGVIPKGHAAETILSDVARQILAMDGAIEQCETRYGKRIKLVDHPVMGPLTGAEWRKFHWVHGRHHAKQILRLRRNIVET